MENWDFPAGVRSMVKAVFHKNQKVFVAPGGTWATIERLRAAVAGPKLVTIRLTENFGAADARNAAWDAATQDGQVIRLVRQPDGWFVEGVVD